MRIEPNPLVSLAGSTVELPVASCAAFKMNPLSVLILLLILGNEVQNAKDILRRSWVKLKAIFGVHRGERRPWLAVRA
jgi:hypothetical protein